MPMWGVIYFELLSVLFLGCGLLEIQVKAGTSIKVAEIINGNPNIVSVACTIWDRFPIVVFRH